MIGNIVGQSFSDYVKDEINIRQQTHGSGFNKESRTPEQINYLNSRLAWVKMASSVEIVDKPSLEEQLISGSENEHGEGTKKLTEIFGGNVEQYMGTGLAKKAVLFNGLYDTTLNTNPTSSNNFRSGISKNNSIWNNSAYGLGGLDFGLQPMPGIISADITHLNRGSIRKAEIKLKAFNKKQFEIIELLYLRLGYTLLLEWGNNAYLDKDNNKEDVVTTLIDNYWFKNNNNNTHLDNLNRIEEYRKKYQGNYDGFFGRVSNFSWTFAQDGSYDISIQLTSLGDVIESLKVNVYDFKEDINVTPVKEDINVTPDDNREKDKISDFLFSLVNSLKLKNLQEKWDNRRTKQVVSTTRLKEQIIDLENSINPLVRDAIEDYTSDFINFDTLFENKKNPFSNSKLDTSNDSTNMDYNNFIRFGGFLYYLQEHIILSVTNDGNNYFPIINVNNDKDVNIMYAEPKQFSIDPKVCLVKNELLAGEITFGDNENSFVSGTRTNINIFNGVIPSSWLVKDKDSNLIYGNLMNIYLNFNFILSSLKSNLDSKGNLSLYNFLNTLCKGINRSLGGVNNLEPIVDELTNSITILDQSVVPGKNQLFNPKKEDPIIQLYGYNPSGSLSNFVKGFNFQTEITPELSTIIAIGATANNEPVGEDATAFSKWNLGLEDRFNKKIKLPSSPIIEQTEEDKIQNLSTEDLENEYSRLKESTKNKFYSSDIATKRKVERELAKRKKIELKEARIKNLNENYTYYLIDAFYGVLSASPRYLKIDSKFISRGQNILKNNLLQEANNNSNNNLNPGSSIGFIPFNLSIGLDGISGLKIYNRLKTDSKFLPRNYPDTLEFIIKQVNHSISNNIWTTDLETITLPINKPKSLKDPRELNELNGEIPEFAEPIIGMPLRPEGGGLGTFGAPRSRGRGIVEPHLGYDIFTEQLSNNSTSAGRGTPIYSPIDGILTINKTKDKKFEKFNIEGTGVFEGIKVELAYVNPELKNGSVGDRSRTQSNSQVGFGQLIGHSVSLQTSTEFFPGQNAFGTLPGRVKGYSDDVADHVHYSVIVNGEHVNPDPKAGVIKYKKRL